MKNESARNFLTSLDDLFKTQEERAQEQKETIVEIPLSILISKPAAA